MGHNHVDVTAGTGTHLATYSYTESAVTVHDEKVAVGEPATDSFVTVMSPSTATANSHLLQLMAGAGNRVRVRRIEIYQSTLCTTAAIMSIEVRRLTTAGTGGTAIGLSVLDLNDGAPGATAMQLPTAKGTEAAGLVLWSGAMYMMQTAGASSVLPNPIIIDFDRLRSKPAVIQAGTANGIAIKNTTAIAAGTVTITLYADETTY